MTTTAPRTTPSAVTSPIFRIRGQVSRWRYPHEKLTPENAEIMRDVNLAPRGVASSRAGWELYNSTVLAGPEAPMGLWQGTFSSGLTKQVVVTRTKVYSDNGTTRTAITGSALSGGADNRVRFAFLKNQLIFTNGVNQVRTWDGDDSTPHNTADITGIPWTVVKDLMVHQNVLVVMGTTEGGNYYPTRVRWCDINRSTFVVDITSWPTANRYEIYDGGPAIIGGVDCWGKAMIFKQDGLYPGGIVYDTLGHLAWELGDPRRGFTPLSRDSIVARPEFVAVAAMEGLVVFNESLEMQVINTDDYQVWAELNQGRLQYAQAYVREADRQVRLLCSSSSNSSGHDYVFVWCWDTGDTWIDRPSLVLSYGTTISLSGAEYDWLGSTTGYLFKGNSGSYRTDNGTQIDWRVKMAPNDLGLPGRLKHVLNLRTLYRYRTGSGTVSLRVHIDDGMLGAVSGTFAPRAAYKWNSGLTWNSGLKWPSSGIGYADQWVNRICHTIAPEWSSNDPATIEGYMVEYIPLE